MSAAGVGGAPPQRWPDPTTMASYEKDGADADANDESRKLRCSMCDAIDGDRCDLYDELYVVQCCRQCNEQHCNNCKWLETCNTCDFPVCGECMGQHVDACSGRRAKRHREAAIIRKNAKARRTDDTQEKPQELEAPLIDYTSIIADKREAALRRRDAIIVDRAAAAAIATVELIAEKRRGALVRKERQVKRH